MHYLEQCHIIQVILPFLWPDLAHRSFSTSPVRQSAKSVGRGCNGAGVLEKNRVAVGMRHLSVFYETLSPLS